jgi:lysyl-tRNA synthetase class 2
MKHTPSDGWRPGATVEVLQQRARMLSGIRAFFSERDVLEVETPILSSAGTPDPALASLATRYTGPLYPHGQNLYLHTSPEFPMKRLLAAGSGAIYQICKVFRDGEAGRLHNPEFTLLEWYRPGFTLDALMREVDALIHKVLERRVALQPTERLSYRDAFVQHLGLDPHQATAHDFAEAARRHDIHPPAELNSHHDVAPWRDLLLTHVIEPRLGQNRLTFIYDYPASQASLARIRPGEPPVAERFEVYLNGIELANGFHELGDADEQLTRFERQLHARTMQKLPAIPLDHHFLSALREGLPDSCGVALGLDRLLLLAVGARDLNTVLSFPIDRA